MVDEPEQARENDNAQRHEHDREKPHLPLVQGHFNPSFHGQIYGTSADIATDRVEHRQKRKPNTGYGIAMGERFNSQSRARTETTANTMQNTVKNLICR